ncbi:MAG: hypothetical protein Q8P68_02065 [Candidatus Peregrinibacteria bacterium]|nr:hypothetical protein [Candidatus Peregrinibacteria bacterium]MDZ4244546.1 hypothetical protein [Candidatus Gracilibacteria bacterium]
MKISSIKNWFKKRSLCSELRHVRGFALVEVLLAISLLSATIITISSLTISMMRANSLNQNHLIATELAREGIEITRNIRDTNWRNYRNWLTDIYSGSGSYAFAVDSHGQIGEDFNVFAPSPPDDDLLYKDVNLNGSYTEYSHLESEDATPFHRIITVTPVLLNSDAPGGSYDLTLPDNYILKVLVESKVYYVDRGNDKEIKLYTELTDWNN